MTVAVDFGNTDWWPFPDIISSDLCNFLADVEAGDATHPFVVMPLPANDNAVLFDGERPPARWAPRFRTVD